MLMILYLVILCIAISLIGIWFKVYLFKKADIYLNRSHLKFIIIIFTIVIAAVAINAWLLVSLDVNSTVMVIVTIIIFGVILPIFYIYFLRKRIIREKAEIQYVAKISAEYQNSSIEIDQIIKNLKQWIKQQGYSSEIIKEEELTIIKVMKGIALWKGMLTFQISGNKEHFSVSVEKSSDKAAFLKGGLIGASFQLQVNKLADGGLNLISKCSGAKRII